MDTTNEAPEVKTPITEEQFAQVVAKICEGVGIYNSCKDVGISTRSYYEYMSIKPETKKHHADAKKCRTEYLLSIIDENNKECLKKLESCEPMRCGAIQRYYDSLNKGVFEMVKKLNSAEYGDKLDITSNNESITREIVITPIQSK